jgi:2-oxoglutarate ferredoxin oxidoreductase subunit gamma
MYKEIICAGFGGQGIMVMGKLIANAAMKEGMEVTWMPSYGAEVRGGTAHSKMVVSDKPIASGLFYEPEDCIVMNRPSFIKFEHKIQKNGLIMINSSLVGDKTDRVDLKIVRIPATEKAKELGNIKIANMVMLGAYQKITNLINLESIIGVLKDVFPPHRYQMLDINKKALHEGVKLADEYQS